MLLESALIAAIPSRHFPCLLASRRRDHRSDLFLARRRCSAGVVMHVFPLNQVPEGVLSLSRDIWVRVTGHRGKLVAISRDAGAIGERVRVVLPDEESDVVVEVVERKLIVCDGAVRYRLLMRPIGGEVNSQHDDSSERTR